MAVTAGQTILALVIEPAQRAAIARLHAAGLLGVTGVGWPVAAVYTGTRLWDAVRRREALLVLQSAQAALFQLGSGLVLGALLTLAAGGFLVLGGSSEILPELPVVDPFSAGGVAVLVLWLASLAAVPTWHVWSIRQVVHAWRRSAGGDLYAYPFVGELVWEEAPRRLKWMVIQEEEQPIESA